MHFSGLELAAKFEEDLRSLRKEGLGRRKIAEKLSAKTGHTVSPGVVQLALEQLGLNGSVPRVPATGVKFEVDGEKEAKAQEDAEIGDLVASRVKAAQTLRVKADKHTKTIRLGNEPIGLFVFGDPHVDNEGCDWSTLFEHVKLAQNTPGVLAACVGDMQDNWVGRLAKLYSKTTVTASDGWRLSEWLLSQLQWLAIVGGNHDCHDDATEVLTKRGWFSFTDVRADDEVLGLDTAGVACWQPIERQVSYDYRGDLHRIETAQVSAAVTPNHRVLYRGRHKTREGVSWSGLEYGTPETLSGRVAIPVSGSGSGKGTKHSSAELRVAAWILTDGCISFYNGHPSRVDIYQRESNADTVRDDLVAAGVPFTVSIRERGQTVVCGRELVKPPEPEVCFRIGADNTRALLDRLDMQEKTHLPSWVWDLSQAQFQVFLDGMMEGDGTWAASGRAGAFYGRKLFVEEMQALCVANGYSASVYLYRDDQYRLNICRRMDSQMDWVNTTEHYEGKIHCLTVPLSNFAVRRNGKVHFSGNSWAHGPGIDPMKWLTEKCGVKCYAPDELRITFNWSDPSLEPVVWVLRHDFSGRSWFHPTHGPHKEAMLDGRCHILTAGHLHQWGMLTTEQRHSRVTHAIRVRGYKRKDDYAREKGFFEQEFGEACLIVIDPKAADPGRIMPFWDLEAGCQYLTWLREQRKP